jgi:hypothetical protein
MSALMGYGGYGQIAQGRLNNNVLAQAATSMLAQANSLSQLALSLLG